VEILKVFSHLRKVLKYYLDAECAYGTMSKSKTGMLLQTSSNKFLKKIYESNANIIKGAQKIKKNTTTILTNTVACIGRVYLLCAGKYYKR